MGGAKKVFKSIGKVFGIGSSEKSSAKVQTVDTTPVTQNVTSQDVSLETDSVENKKRKRNGARSLDTAVNPVENSIVGGAASGDKRDVTGA